MTTLGIWLLVSMFPLGPASGSPPIPVPRIDPDDVTMEWIQGVFKQAFVTTEIDEDGDLVLSEGGSTIGWLRLDRERQVVNIFAIGSTRSDADPVDRLTYVNELNANIMGAQFYVTPDGLLVADLYVFYEAGITDKQLVYHYQRFRDALQAAIRRDTGNLLGEGS